MTWERFGRIMAAITLFGLCCILIPWGWALFRWAASASSSPATAPASSLLPMPTTTASTTPTYAPSGSAWQDAEIASTQASQRSAAAVNEVNQFASSQRWNNRWTYRSTKTGKFVGIPPEIHYLENQKQSNLRKEAQLALTRENEILKVRFESQFPRPYNPNPARICR